jgi:hypothetical protein
VQAKYTNCYRFSCNSSNNIAWDWHRCSNLASYAGLTDHPATDVITETSIHIGPTSPPLTLSLTASPTDNITDILPHWQCHWEPPLTLSRTVSPTDNVTDIFGLPPLASLTTKLRKYTVVFPSCGHLSSHRYYHELLRVFWWSEFSLVLFEMNTDWLW